MPSTKYLGMYLCTEGCLAGLQIRINISEFGPFKTMKGFSLYLNVDGDMDCRSKVLYLDKN